MTWVKIDDKLTTHPKWLSLSLEAKSLWFHAAVWCGAHNNDGALPEHAMALIAFSGSVPSRDVAPAVDLLVKAKLWRRVPKAKGGGWEINDWLTYQPSKQQVQDREAKKAQSDEMKRLHAWLHKSPIGKRVKGLVVERDGTTCCYCGQADLRTDGDRRGLDRRTFDLIDPASKDEFDWSGAPMARAEVERVARLWCVACSYCNQTKNSRRPDETIDMQILPGHGPFRDLPRSAATESRLSRGFGSDPVGSGLVGAGVVVPAGAPPSPSDDPAYLESLLKE